MKAIAALLALILGLAALPRAAQAEAYLRVIAIEAPVLTGPGEEYRELDIARRNQVFEVLERSTIGYWFRVEMEDGTTGWIAGDQVFPFEERRRRRPGLFTRMWRSIRGALLGPPPAPYSDVQLSFSAGVLDREGVFFFRPAWLVDSYFAIEGFAGLSPRSEKDVFLGGLGATLRLAPSAHIGPFVHVSVGATHFRPKSDNFIDRKETLMALSAGGGFEITFKKQITLRLDARNWTLFDENQASNGQEYSGGFAVFF
jgi:hypothetical protein